MKTGFLQRRKIERIVYLHPTTEVNTSKVWKLQKCVYGLADASRYWYLHVREELLKLGAKISSLDPGLFYWLENNTLIGVLACHVDDIWGENQYFKGTIFLKKFSTLVLKKWKHSHITYIGIGLKQNANFRMKIDQNSYINSIQEIALSKERMKDQKNSLTPSEKTLHRSIVCQLNWVAGISRPDISFAVCESSTKFIYANKKI